MVPLILICKHHPPLSTLNGAKVLKSLAVFKSEIGQGLRRIWEGLGPVKCLVTGPHSLQLMQWEGTPRPSPPGHYLLQLCSLVTFLRLGGDSREWLGL